MGDITEVARLARDLIGESEHWTKGEWCTDKDGLSVAYGSAEAHSFCIEGAIGHAAALHLGVVETDGFDPEKALFARTASSLTTYDFLREVTPAQKRMVEVGLPVIACANRVAFERFGFSTAQSLNDQGFFVDGLDGSRMLAQRSAEHQRVIDLMDEVVKRLDQQGA